MSSTLLLTLAFLAITSCHAFPPRMAPDAQQLLSLISQRFASRHPPYSRASREDDDDSGDDNFGNSNEDNNNNDDGDDDDGDDDDILPYHNQHQSMSGLTSPIVHSTGDDRNVIRDHLAFANAIPLYPLQNGMNSNELMRLKAGIWALQRSREGADMSPRGQLTPSEVFTGRGKRYIPGLNALMLARYISNRNSRLVDAGKWKRQPHLGFHGSRG